MKYIWLLAILLVGCADADHEELSKTIIGKINKIEMIDSNSCYLKPCLIEFENEFGQTEHVLLNIDPESFVLRFDNSSMYKIHYGHWNKITKIEKIVNYSTENRTEQRKIIIKEI